MGSFRVILAMVLAAVPGSLCKKPVKEFFWPVTSINSDLRGFLEGTQIQVDQTGNPSHAVNLISPFPGVTCHPATPAERMICLINCRRQFAGQPNLLKMCVSGCDGAQDCSNQCGSHSTANFVKYGFDMMLALNQSCTPNRSSPDVNGTDITNLVPNPIYDGCRLTRLSISFSEDITTTEVIPGKGIHINVKAEADDPTMRCGGVIGNPTWHHTSFDLYFNPSVSNHKVNWAATSALNVDVGWWLDWIYQLNHKVKTAVNTFMNNLLGNPTVALDIDKVLTFQLAQDLKKATGDDVDDFLTISAVNASGILVTYVPLCENGDENCGCTTSCNGLHFCEDQYWNATATAAPCGSGQTCLSNGVCCAPRCRPGACGSDGCGGTCKTCAAGQQCVNNVCQGCTPDPNCGTKLCHMNACGFYCGHCKLGFNCDANEGCVGTGQLPGKIPRALLASK